MALGLAGFMSFSLHDAIAKYLAGQGYHPVFITYSLSLIMIMGLVLLAPKLGGWRNTLKTREKKLHLIRTALIAPVLPLNVFAFSHLPMSTAYAVLMCTPMLTTLLARFWLNEKHPAIVYGMIVSGFCGVLICLHPQGDSFAALPLLCVSMSACFGAVRANLLRKAHADETPLSLMLYPCMGVNMIYMVPAMLHAEAMQLAHFGLLLVEGVLFTLGFIGTTISYRNTPAAFAGMTHYSQILWGIALGWLLFGTHPDSLTLLGAAVIIVSGITLVWMSRPRKVLHDLDVEID